MLTVKITDDRMLECVNLIQTLDDMKIMWIMWISDPHNLLKCLKEGYVIMERLSTNNKVVGAKQVTRALNSGEVEIVFIAKDAEEKVTQTITELCKFKQIEMIHVNNMKGLGDACGIDINAAVAALLK